MIDNFKVYQGVDLIGGAADQKSGRGESALVSTKGAYFVIFTAGVDALGTRYVLNILRLRGVSYNNQLSYIKSHNQKFCPEIVTVEDNNAQKWIAQELIRTTAIPVHSFTTTANKRDMAMGVPSLAVEFENGKWRLPYGDDRTKKLIDVFIEELAGYPFASTSDILMACWLCSQGMRGRHKTLHIVKDIAKAMAEDTNEKKSLYDQIASGELT